MSTRRYVLIAALTAFVAAFVQSPFAVAQTGAKGPNGGMLGGADDHQIELVVSEMDVSVFVIEKGKPHQIGKTQLRMIVQSGGKTSNHTLTLAAPDRLTAKLAEPLAKGSIVVISGRDDHGHSMSARFAF